MTDLIPTDKLTEVKQQSTKTLNEPTDNKEKLWGALDKVIEELATVKVAYDKGQDRRPENISAAREFLPIMKAQLSAFPVPRVTTECDGTVHFQWLDVKLKCVVLCVFHVDIEDEEVSVSTCGRKQIMDHRDLQYSPGNHDQEQAVIAVLQQFLKEVFP